MVWYDNFHQYKLKPYVNIRMQTQFVCIGWVARLCNCDINRYTCVSTYKFCIVVHKFMLYAYVTPMYWIENSIVWILMWFMCGKFICFWLLFCSYWWRIFSFDMCEILWYNRILYTRNTCTYRLHSIHSISHSMHIVIIT